MDGLAMLNMMGSIMTKEGIIEILKDTIRDYEANPTTSGFERIGLTGTIINMMIAQKREGGALKVNESIAKAKRASELINKIEGKTN